MSKEINVSITPLQALEVFAKGTKAWFPDQEEGWVSASCLSKKIENDKVTLLFEDDNDNSKVNRQKHT